MILTLIRRDRKLKIVRGVQLVGDIAVAVDAHVIQLFLRCHAVVVHIEVVADVFKINQLHLVRRHAVEGDDRCTLRHDSGYLVQVVVKGILPRLRVVGRVKADVIGVAQFHMYASGLPHRGHICFLLAAAQHSRQHHRHSGRETLHKNLSFVWVVGRRREFLTHLQNARAEAGLGLDKAHQHPHVHI